MVLVVIWSSLTAFCAFFPSILWQVSVIQYAVNPKFEFRLNDYKTKDQVIAAASRITQMYGHSTNTFHAIQYARLVLPLCVYVFIYLLVRLVACLVSCFSYAALCVLSFRFFCDKTTNSNLKVSTVSALFSQWGFHQSNGGRPSAAKVMVVVTDGESHDEAFRDTVIAECEKQGITRFGIAVSDDPFTRTMSYIQQ